MTTSKRLSILLALTLGSMLSGSSVARADSTIQRITYDGSGSPKGTVAVSISNDGTAFSLSFLQLAIKLDQFTGFNQVSKNSKIKLKLSPGHGGALLSTQMRGSLYLSSGATATVAIWANGEGSEDEGKGPVVYKTFYGATSNPIVPLPFLLNGLFDVKGSAENLNIQIQISRPNSSSIGYFTVDELDGQLTAEDGGGD